MEVEEQEEYEEEEEEHHQQIELRFDDDSLMEYRRDFDRLELLEDLWNEKGSLFTKPCVHHVSDENVKDKDVVEKSIEMIELV